MTDDSFLTEIINASIITLKESTFKRIFLPLLFRDNPEDFNKAWIDHVAKVPHARVNVVDDKGDFLFSVPPLRIDPVVIFNKDLVNRLTGAFNIKETNPIMAGKLLNTVLENDIGFSRGITDDTKLEWETIFDRYGLTKYYLNSSTNTAGEINQGCTIEPDDNDW
jgi:hypothetical protein